jgi:type I restriction enzyme S subunit
MPNIWPLVPLEELLTPVSRPETVDADKTYRILGAHWYAQGLYVKDITTGAGIQAKSLYRVEEGDFVYNRLFAWKGSFALATKENHGCYVSNEFPCFAVNRFRLDGRFLWQFFSRSSVWDDALSESTGGTPTSRNRLKEHKFLAFKIPLPPLDEQRRIVARIEQLAAKIEEARQQNEHATETAGILYEQARNSAFRSLQCERKPIGELFTLINGRAFKPDEWGESGRRIVRIQNLKYRDASFNKFAGPVDQKHLIRDGDVLFAWSGQVVSLGAHIWHGQEAVLNQHIFNVKSLVPMHPKFVREGFNALIGQMKAQVRGLEMFHIRKQEIDRLLFPMISMQAQHRMVDFLDDLQAKVDALKKLQAETAAELDALLPSILDRAFRGELVGAVREPALRSIASDALKQREAGSTA